MPFREKRAWLMLVSIAAAYVPYFVIVSHTAPSGARPDWHMLMLYLGAVLRQVIILGIGFAVLYLTAREDAKLPADERDRDIERRSTVTGYYILLTGMILVGCIMPITNVGWSLINSAICAIVVAEFTRYSLTVWFYRRQA